MKDNPYLEVRGEDDILRFPSWGEFIDFAMEREAAPSATRQSSRRLDSEHDGGYNSSSWYESENIEEAHKLASEGWPEGTKKITALSNVLIDKITSLIEQSVLEYNVTGTDFDMGSYLTGTPEHWYTIKNPIELGEGKRIIRLVLNCAVSAGISSSVIIAKGATVAALIQTLEYSGYRVELMLTEQVSRGYSWDAAGRMETYVPIKAADQYLDLDRLSFALAHPSTLRRFVFAVQESVERFMKSCNHSYGSCVAVKDPKAIADIIIENSFLGEPQWEDPDSAIKWVLKELQAQGVQVSEGEDDKE